MAREEAARLHHEYVSTEHILLGLIREGEGVACTVLQNLTVDADEIRQKIDESVKKGKATPTTGPDLPYTSSAKKVLELAMSAARELSHSYVGTEHLLLGLLREKKGIAAQVLMQAGVTLDAAHAETRRILGTVVPQQPLGQDHMRAQASIADRGRSTMNGFNFTEGIRRTLGMAREEAARLHHEYVGCEHILLGMLKRDDGVAIAVLDELGIDRDALKASIEQIVKEGKASETTGPDLPYTNRAKKSLELAMKAARDLGQSHVGSEHLLLGILDEKMNIAAQVLTEAGLTREAAIASVLEIVGSEMPHARPQKADSGRGDGWAGPSKGTPTLVVVELRYEGGWTRRREFRTPAEARAFLAAI
jgi:ATP-dependent Clp protease ATP-binding subunit ClpA